MQEKGGPPHGLKVLLTGRDMFLWPCASVKFVSRTRGPLYWVTVLWQRRHWSPAPELVRRPPGPYAASSRAGITQAAMQVPVVTQVPPCLAQTTSLRSSLSMTIEQVPLAFQRRSTAAVQAVCVVLTRSAQTPVLHEYWPAEPRAVHAAEFAAVKKRATHSGRVFAVRSAGQEPCLGRSQPPREFCTAPSPTYLTPAWALPAPRSSTAPKARTAVDAIRHEFLSASTLMETNPLLEEIGSGRL
ncbi:MAG: hypothetical protein IPP07_18345 [Holophagales bacterium]|nr:hypothetical protein [Holophagales bacterium]